jgi:serine/threonine protein kinase/Flp pilus assembly protein TadD
MTTWNPQANELFLKALELRSADERQEYLDRACASDAALRAEVESLLEAGAQAGSFLESPARAPQLVATVDETPIAERPGTVIGAYKLLEQIGEGGFGVVFMAEQTQPVRRKVALKVLKPGMDTRQVVARFEAERQALALMDHPNIAHILDGGATDGEPGCVSAGRPYFVMELVRGISITEFCDQSHLSIRERLELFLSVCQAVQHAHHKGIIHRDIKPSNVLVTLHDDKAVVKVIDFGIAKATGQQLTDKTLFTNFAQMIGTPLYMSPEQAQMSGLDVDTRSDIYSLGVLLYELLTGTTPFDKERLRTVGFDEVRRIIREEEPARPSTRMSTLAQAVTTASANRQSDPKRLSQLLRGELDWIVMKALEKDRNRRYDTASAFAADVQHYLCDEPVLACPPSARYRFGKFTRRNKRALATASVFGLAALLVVGVVAGGVGWMAHDRSVRHAKLNLVVERALDDATRARDQALKQTDYPEQWKAALAEAASDLKRAQGLANQDETALEPGTRERLHGLQALLNADDTDCRFAARFEQMRLQQMAAMVTITEVKMGIAFTGLKDAFHRHYRVEFGATPAKQAVAIIQQRPKAIQDILLAALEVCLDDVPRDDRPTRQWLASVLDAADTGPWRKRAEQALVASNWKALEQVIEEAVTARRPPSRLLRLARQTPRNSPICLAVARRICQAYPVDFWANHDLAAFLHHRKHPQLEEAIRYYGAALVLRPHEPAACVSLGNALSAQGNLDAAIRAYREALDGHPNYIYAHERLALALERKRDLDGAITEIRETIRLRRFAPGNQEYSWDHIVLGRLLQQKGLHDEAIAAWQSAIKLNPKNAVAYNNVSWQFLAGPKELRNPKDALPSARKAVELEPQNYLYVNTLGVALYRNGEFREAIPVLQRSLAVGKGVADAFDLFFLAMCYHRLGEPGKARNHYDRAVAWLEQRRNKLPAGWLRELIEFQAEARALLGLPVASSKK